MLHAIKLVNFLCAMTSSLCVNWISIDSCDPTCLLKVLNYQTRMANIEHLLLLLLSTVWIVSFILLCLLDSEKEVKHVNKYITVSVPQLPHNNTCGSNQYSWFDQSGYESNCPDYSYCEAVCRRIPHLLWHFVKRHSSCESNRTSSMFICIDLHCLTHTVQREYNT